MVKTPTTARAEGSSGVGTVPHKISCTLTP